MNCGVGLAFDEIDQTCKFLHDVSRCSGRSLTNPAHQLTNTPQSISHAFKQSADLSTFDDKKVKNEENVNFKSISFSRTTPQPVAFLSPSLNTQKPSNVFIPEQQSFRRERPVIRKVVIARRLPNGEFSILKPQSQLLQSLARLPATRHLSPPPTSQSPSAVEPKSDDLDDDQEADVPPSAAANPQPAGQQVNVISANRQSVQPAKPSVAPLINPIQSNHVKPEIRILGQPSLRSPLTRHVPAKESLAAKIKKSTHPLSSTQLPAQRAAPIQTTRIPTTTPATHAVTIQPTKSQEIAFNRPTYPPLRSYSQSFSPTPLIPSIQLQPFKPILSSVAKPTPAVSRTVSIPLQASPRAVQNQVTPAKEVLQQSQAPFSFSHELTINHVVEVPDEEFKQPKSFATFVRQNSPVVTLEQPIYHDVADIVPVSVNARSRSTFANSNSSPQGSSAENDDEDPYEDVQ